MPGYQVDKVLSKCADMGLRVLVVARHELG